jgi:cation:H+ antiporter
VQFALGAIISLGTSWLLVTRLERIGERFGFTEGLLGLVAALAADAPEITSAVSASSQHQTSIGAGVVIGSNVFNVAALLGVGALVAGFVTLHRRVVIFGGLVATWTALCSVLAVTHLVSDVAALAMAMVVFVPYVGLLSVRHRRLLDSPLPLALRDWLLLAVVEEEAELDETIRPSRASGVDYVVAMASLAAVVLASVVMEHGATRYGHQNHVPDVVIGALVLAAVTGLPNAVAGVHLAARRRGAAALSTTLNSNNMNVIVGLLLPGLFVGLAPLSLTGGLTTWWYLGVTVLTLGAAYLSRGLHRWQGAGIVLAFFVFAAIVFAVA